MEYTGKKINVDLDDSDSIIVAGKYYSHIIELLEIKYLEYKQSIHSIFELYLEVFGKILEEDRKINEINVKDIKQMSESLIILKYGFALGGIEVWAVNLFRELQEKKIICKFLDIPPCRERLSLDNKFYHISDEKIYKINKKEGFIEQTFEIVRQVLRIAPKTCIDNGSYEFLTAMYYLKKKKCKLPKIYLVIHNNSDEEIVKAVMFKEIVKCYVAVSDEVRETILKFIKDKEVITEIQMPSIRNINRGEKFFTQKIINIAYVSRLEKKVKQTDKIFEIIDGLEKQEVNYILHIVGIGSMLEELCLYIKEKKLETKVKIYGVLNREEIMQFYCKMHIYINASILEGTSLAMLEAMSCGVIPIVTRTSGVEGIINNGENGYIVNSFQETVKYIKELYMNRKRMKKISDSMLQKARDIHLKGKKLVAYLSQEE